MTAPQTPPHSLLCPECGLAFDAVNPKGANKLYCSEDHRVAFNNRLKSRGQALTLLALAWRQGRGSTTVSKDAYAELCRVLDLFTADDVAAGRPKVVSHAAQVLKSGRYIDRRRAVRVRR